MIKKYISFTLACLLLITANSAFVSAQTRINTDASAIANIKSEVVKRSTRKHRGIELKKFDGTKIRGDITQTGEDSFTVTDTKTNQNTIVAYNEVSKMKIVGTSITNKVVVSVAIAAAATVAAVGIISYILIRRILCGCRNRQPHNILTSE